VKKTLLAATAAACLLAIVPSASEARPSEPTEAAHSAGLFIGLPFLRVRIFLVRRVAPRSYAHSPRRHVASRPPRAKGADSVSVSLPPAKKVTVN